MREIKFRAWNHLRKAWCNNFVMSSDGSEIWDTGDRFNTEEEVTLCEFTGLRDKNGKEIYEGDIVELTPLWPEQPKTKHEVKRFYSDFNKEPRLKPFNRSHQDVSILGSIYENPELLK